MSYSELLNRLDRLEAVLSNVVRVAEVDAVYPAEGKASVVYHDLDGMKSKPLPVLQSSTFATKFYALPDPGDHVLVVNLPIGLEGGFIVGSLYSAADTPPANDKDIYKIQFSDGGVIEYNRASHTATLSGLNVIAQAGTKVVIESDDINLGGEGGAYLARIGDMVDVGAGSSQGQWPIITGSEKVKAK